MFSPGSRTAQSSGHHNAPRLGPSVLGQHGRSSGLACMSTVAAGDFASRHAAPPEEGEEVQAVMERMALVKLARHADQTQQELEKMRTRVDRTMEAFELGNRAVMDSLKRANMECFENLFFDHSSILTDGESSKDLDVDISHSTQKVQEALESTRQAMVHLGTLHSALISLTSHTGSAKEKKRYGALHSHTGR
uniref:Uncharacterized protein LOC116942012 isoform X2 n=1 Tax=Petromyzon marinus TaxID=7757 RepID=A0AAJ7T1H5_PETMA|nr:uncharacterized protein LOC116942012 isoform X2 [Petromyzon marinus]